jgi:hypothetical protein
MGFEDEAEQSFGRPCRQTNGRSKQTYEDPPSLRAHAPTGPFRCTRRVPPRRHRSKSQDPCELSLAATAEYASRLSRVSVSGVNVNRESNVVAPRRERRASDRQKRKLTAPPVTSPTLSTPSVKLRSGDMSALSPLHSGEQTLVRAVDRSVRCNSGHRRLSR